VTDLTRHRRLAEQGSLDRADLDAILDAGFVCHLGVVIEGRPVVVPTVYGRDGRRLYFHGSVASRSLTGGAPVCVTVTHVDGLVLARSVFEHGVNYRSAMIHGVPRKVTDPEEKLAGLRRLTEHATPGQWSYARLPNRKELAATTLLALSLEEASVKIRTGPRRRGRPRRGAARLGGNAPTDLDLGHARTGPGSAPGHPGTGAHRAPRGNRAGLTRQRSLSGPVVLPGRCGAVPPGTYCRPGPTPAPQPRPCP
jgi:nitroimidazol reductase NimA-like FMN-containing flavoprotein (pyridoxamine 5'-phosphate oxidase superfamily)